MKKSWMGIGLSALLVSSAVMAADDSNLQFAEDTTNGPAAMSGSSAVSGADSISGANSAPAATDSNSGTADTATGDDDY